MTADHTPERLSEEEREAICRAGFSTHDHLLQRDPAIAAFEAILAAHLADVEARVEAALTSTDTENGVSCAGLTVDADGCFAADVAKRVRAALHLDPSEPTRAGT